jgi:hypothetical protein
MTPIVLIIKLNRALMIQAMVISGRITGSSGLRFIKYIITEGYKLRRRESNLWLENFIVMKLF